MFGKRQDADSSDNQLRWFNIAKLFYWMVPELATQCACCIQYMMLSMQEEIYTQST